MKTGKKLNQKNLSTSIPRNKPILFWDTCGLLKIFHLPEEKRIADIIALFNHFLWILDKIKNDEIISMTSEMVITELDQHFTDVKGNLVKNQNDARDNLLKYVLFIVPEKKKTSYQNVINKVIIEHRLDNVLKEILKKTYILKEHSDYAKNAHFRVKNKKAPACRKSEYKDCYIWASFVYIINKLQDYTKAYFYTDNKDDYYYNRSLYPDIQTDLSEKNAKVIISIAESRSLI